MKENCLICNYINKKKKLNFPYKTFFNSKTFEYIECQNCKSIYLNKDLTDEDLSKIYNEDYHKTFYDFGTEQNNKFFQIAINKLNKKNNIKICDFGCGNCNKLEILSNNNSKVGIEYSKFYVENLKIKFPNYNFYTYQDFEKKKDFLEYFDLIILGDVLEHTNDPFNLLFGLTKNLKKNGHFIIEGPIEENQNLIYFCTKIFGFFKYLLKIKNNFKPYHTFRTNHNAQKLFFNRFYNLSIVSYYSHETGWPYKKNGLIKDLISKLNYLFFFKKNTNFNNRFICTLKKI